MTMNEQDQELLLKDLCARLPYRVKGRCEIDTSYDTSFDTILQFHKFDAILEGVKEGGSLLFVTPLIENQDEQEFANEEVANGIDILDFKPYLRPMSSMTEEEAITIFKIIYGDDTEFSSVEVSDNCIEIWDYDYNEDGFSERTVCTIYFEEIVRSMEVLDYILSRHFDVPHWNESENIYKTMIGMGLALLAPEGMYYFI